MPTRRQLAAYGLPALPLAALGIPVHVHLPAFYAHDLGLGLGAVGGVLLVSRLLDVLADPLIGLACDRGRHRRKVWMAAGLPLLALSGWQLFLPPAGIGPLHLMLWSALFYASLTMVLVPYQAWGAEWSPDYAERTRIAGWREAFALVGIVAAIAVPGALSLSRGESLAALFPPSILLLVAATILIALAVPERPSLAGGGIGALRPLLVNRPFRRLLAAQALNAFANALPATLFLLYVGDRLGRPDLAGPLLLAYLLAGVVTVPLWVAASRLWGKHRAWGLSLAVAALAFLPVPLLGPGDWLLFVVLCVASGLGLGADLALPAAMLADVVDEHAAHSGEDRAGLYVALWGLTGKLALALAIGVAFPLLDLAGFVPGSGSAPLALPLLYAGVPVVLKLCAALVILRFPLDRARQAALRQRIALLTGSTP